MPVLRVRDAGLLLMLLFLHGLMPGQVMPDSQDYDEESGN